MTEYFHSVRLEFEKCKGCTNCIKRCPMEAIRVHEGKATIMQERCIDCGECIRACPNHAKISVTDTLEILNDYKYRIALPAPSFFAQFKEVENVEYVLNALLNIGFDDVFEVALAAEVVGFLIHQYIKENKVKKPVFSSACPAVLRLMQIKYPDLLEHVAPVLTPMEVAARMAKEEAIKKTGLSYEDIGAFFISPCPAKVTEMKNPMNTKHSAVNGVIGVNLIYKDIVKQVIAIKTKKPEDFEKLHKATGMGMAWGYVTGESKNVDMGKALA
ncbi:MAG TPA: [Fe-Fe] hydrogenase large subunit C-terminal domain-containing protein, partial [Syntrophorhabdaceae bacterium]|nr:[Fe-Fe] hydrogenase large subunit C-terminal domain-containing protein [Syntrophorhabdaceae bacterium]